MSTTDDLIAFLRARLDEDEWAARAAKDVAAKRTHYRASVTVRADRELRDVGAKRKLVDFWAIAYSKPGDFPGHDWDKVRANAVWTVRLLALRYADHDDYREEWRP